MIATAKLDLHAAIILAEGKCPAQSLFYFQQTYEKAVKSLYVGHRISQGVDLRTIEIEIKDKDKDKLGHKNKEISARLLETLFKALRKLETVIDQEEMKKNLEAVEHFRKAVVEENAIMTRYLPIVQQIQETYRTMTTSSTRIPTRFVILAVILSLCLHGIETTSRYPFARYKYENVINLSKDENSVVCKYLNGMMRDFLNTYGVMFRLFTGATP